MEIAFALLALLLLAVVMGVVAVIRGVRAAKRGIQRAGREVRRTVSDATLAARAAQPGVVGELARIRKDLRACLDGTRHTLRLATEEDQALSEALALLDRLDGHHRQLDGELSALMSGEPDRSRIAARMPELRKRAEDIKRSADALRYAAQERAGRHDAQALDDLHRQIDMEASALRHWDPVDGGPGGPGGLGAPGGGDGVRGTGGPGDVRGTGGADGTRGAGAAPGSAPAPGSAGPSGPREQPDPARELRGAPESPAPEAEGFPGASASRVFRDAWQARKARKAGEEA